jgi:hypothetical protein
MVTPQLQARLLDRPVRLGHLATAQVGQRRKIVSVGQVAPLRQQIANGAFGQGELLGDVLDGKASLVQLKELLAQWHRGSTRHERDLQRGNGINNKEQRPDVRSSWAGTAAANLCVAIRSWALLIPDRLLLLYT